MIQDRWQSFWKLLGFFVVCNAIITGFGNSASAQIVPDNTLGNEKSQVTNNPNLRGLPGQLIEGGAIRGVNLFQSFSQFQVGDGERVYFANPAGIENILSRVTGNDPSKIFGLLGVNGNANLFFINPNGIIFGQNARLDVAGSFVGTTANAIGFGQNGFFSASSPQAPSQLLTVNPSVLLVNQINAASIQNNATTTGLQVSEGRSLLLVGGNVSMDGGRLIAPGGRVELGGLAAAGTIGLNTVGNIFSLSFPIDVPRADVSLINRAILGVVGNSGSIAINAGNIDVPGGSSLIDETELESSYVYIEAENLTLNATGTIKFEQAEILSNDVNITTDSLLFRNNILNTGIDEEGDGGSLNINANKLVSSDNDSRIFSRNINITTDSLSLRKTIMDTTTSQSNVLDTDFVENGNRITTNGGNNITINARNIDIVEGSELRTGLTGIDSQAGNIALLNATEAIKIDRARIESENVNIKTGSLSLIDTILDSGSNERGNVGSVIIDAKERAFFEKNQIYTGQFNITTDSLSFKDDKVTSDNINIASKIVLFNLSNVYTDNINITTNSLSAENSVLWQLEKIGSLIINAKDSVLFNKSSVLSSGNTNITTGLLSLIDTSFTTGDLIVDAKNRVFLNGEESNITSSFDRGTSDKPGNVRITTGELSVTNGALISSTSTFDSFLGSIDGGNIIIDARDRVIFDGGQASTSVRLVPLDIINTFIGRAPSNTLRGGEIRITTGELSVINNGSITAAANTEGRNFNRSNIIVGKVDAGGIIINVRDRVIFDNGTASTSLGRYIEGKGGDINITTTELLVKNDSELSASTDGQGNAGNIIVNAKERVFFDGVSNSNTSSAIFTSVNSTGTGNGGNIHITASELSILNGARFIATTNGKGNAGNIEVITFNTFNVSGTNSKNGNSSGLFANTNTTGKSGNINVNTNVFHLSDGAVLDARTSNNGKGGNITINANLFEALNGGQLLSVTSGTGNAGKIAVNAKDRVIVNGTDATFNDRLDKFGTTAANVDAASGFFVLSSGSGIAGDIEVNSPKITLDNGGRFIAESTFGNGGNINLQVSDLLLMRRGAQISTSAGTDQEGGDGGNINLNAQFLVAIPNENSDIIANAFTGSGGKVTINTSGIYGLQLLSGAELRRLNANSNPRELLTNDISAVSQQGGPQLDGQITVNNPDVDPNNGLVSLPVDVIDPSNQIAQGCAAFDEATASDFKVTGRGGLPPSPDETLSSNAVWEDTRLRATTAQRLDSKTTATKPQSESDTVITPATGWVFNGKGDVTLVSQMPNATAETLAASSQSCYLR
ncbi:filamentous hemagglutinin N-terminal domain-containing protein [Scytonema sp. UIC 10036]|uniref:two-partner secretion domain-containing protein n=1 Tax=Scytonema sp. UIC 10036 TaxID=2304196 RepID=UPI0012DA1A5D|nr:filamentous hemagglutinin N-terminal domain-containing protein [Scytonema sp. UIC 10036]MUG93732.1 filamentous hemagglutinin N-terminal domain-containing protein [Scytonema sp. UIC 10036]